MSHPLSIGVNQGSEFSNAYPFVKPLPDVRGVLLDFYLSFETSVKPTDPPDILHLAWLHGFGTISSSVPAGRPTPTHAYDLVVVNDNGAVIFDSTTALAFEVRPWGSRIIVSWQTTRAVCRVVTAGTPSTAFPTNIAPVRTELDVRAYRALPPRLRRIKYGNQYFDGDIIFQNGFNTQLTADQPARQDGTRFVSRIRFDAAPGDGLGTFPGCQDAQVVVQTIAGVGPNAGGNLALDGMGCYRVQTPVTIGTLGGRRIATYGNLDVTGSHKGLLINNDCQPCCPCSAFTDTYKGVNNVWNLWQSAASQAEAIRDSLKQINDRVAADKACREAHSTRLTIMTEPNCFIQVIGSFCNPTDCCIPGVVLHFGCSLADGFSSDSASLSLIRAQSSANGDDFAAGSLGGAYPNFTSTSAAPLEPGKTFICRFRLKLDNCDSGKSLTVTMTATMGTPIPGSSGPCSTSSPVPVTASAPFNNNTI